MPGFLGGEAVEDLEETMLAFPRVADGGGILTLLSALEGDTGGWPSAVVPGGLDEDMT